MNLIHKIANNICIPKIVPLVYDDVLSYYEMLNKLLQKVNELIDLCNSLGIRVEALEAAVIEIQSALDSLDGRLDDVESTVSSLSNDVGTLNTAVETINGAISTINNSIETINNYITNNDQNIANINAAISDIEDTLNTIDLTELSQDVASLDARVSALEEATIGQLTPAPVPKNLCVDLTQATPNDVEIIKDETGKERDSVVFVDDAADPAKNGFSFDYNTTDFNACHLRFFNVCPREMTESSTEYVPTYTIAWLADTYANLYGYNQGRPVATIRTLTQLLTGVTLDPADYYIAYIQMVPSATNDSYYDLLVYPQHNGEYAVYNAIMRELYVFNSSGLLTEGKGEPSDRWKLQKYKYAYQQAVQDLIDKSTSDVSSRLTELETDVGALETAVGDFTESAYNTWKAGVNNSLDTISGRVNTNAADIDSLESAVNGINQVRSWTNFSDVFENGDIPETASILGFKCQVSNKAVTMELWGAGFIGTGYPLWFLGTLRSGVRQYLTPYNDDAVSGTGVTTTDWNNHTAIGMQGTSLGIKMPDTRGVAFATLTGSKTTNPYAPEYPNSAYSAYSLYLTTTSPSNTNSGFIIRLTYRAK